MAVREELSRQRDQPQAGLAEVLRNSRKTHVLSRGREGRGGDRPGASRGIGRTLE